LHRDLRLTTFQPMAVTETGHVASREIDDLYRRYGTEVYRYAYAVLGNHADAEDVTQTTFLNAYRALEQGVRPRKPSNWLLTIASNAIKQRFRQEQARPRVVELDDRIAGQEADDDGPSVGELLTALSKIPPQQRQAIVLREFEGRSYAEIAEILGVTTSALETLLFRARRSLADELEHQLTCTDAQLAISKSVDDRLGRKERRRLKDHLAECPDCAHFARLQQRHRSALRGLLLVPIPLSLSIFKGLEGAGTASAATIPVAAGASTAVGAGAVATSIGVGSGTATATGGGLFAGGVAIKAAAAVAAVSVAGGAVTGASELTKVHKPKTAPAATKPGERVGQVAPHGVSVPGNGVARGKSTAPGQVKKAETAASTSRSSKALAVHAAKSRSAKKGPAGKANGKRVAGAKRANASKPKPTRGNSATASTKVKANPNPNPKVKAKAKPAKEAPKPHPSTAPASSDSGGGDGKSAKAEKADTSSSPSTDSASGNGKARGPKP
jgi:RNA polymerase sigma factor (sigma-70 family)